MGAYLATLKFEGGQIGDAYGAFAMGGSSRSSWA